jgi:hypothetical protein
MIFRIAFEPEAGQADRQNPAGSCSMVACTFTLQPLKRLMQTGDGLFLH